MGEFLARNAEALVRSIGVHLFYTLVSVAIGFVLGLGLGILLSRFPRQARFILPLLSLFNTIPGVVFIGLLFLVLHIQPATVLIALSICAATNPTAELAMAQLKKLRGCEAHATVILSHVDEDTFRRLGVNLTCEPQYQSKKLYHK